MPSDDLESGYTTGTYATATTKAGLKYLCGERCPETVVLPLPAGEEAKIDVDFVSSNGQTATFSSVKDAGDDPDVTDGATIRTQVQLDETGRIDYVGGDGVGTVTLPGLPVPEGEPAINPVPREMMESVATDILNRNQGVRLKVSIEDGEDLAERTLNPRLGIEDGLSILGTTGIVEPYSNASYVASIEQGLDVAERNGLAEVVLSTGGRTEEAARREVNLPKLGFVQFAGFLQETLDHLVEKNFRNVHFYFMPGKFSKFAQGHLKLHSDDSTVDLDQIRSELDHSLGVSSEIIERVSGLRSVNQIFSKLNMSRKKELIQRWLQRIPDLVSEKVGPIASDSVSMTILTLEGDRLGRLEWTP